MNRRMVDLTCGLCVRWPPKLAAPRHAVALLAIALVTRAGTAQPASSGRVDLPPVRAFFAYTLRLRTADSTVEGVHNRKPTADTLLLMRMVGPLSLRPRTHRVAITAIDSVWIRRSKAKSGAGLGAMIGGVVGALLAGRTLGLGDATGVAMGAATGAGVGAMSGASFGGRRTRWELFSARR
jgi:hypothetical protein